MVEHMYKQVFLKTMTTIQTSRFLLITCDEIMTTFGQCIMDINTCICCQKLVLISLDHVLEGENSKNLTKVIMAEVCNGGGLGK
jgi:hypothetical protein